MQTVYRAVQSASFDTELRYFCPAAEPDAAQPGFQLPSGDLLRPTLQWVLDGPGLDDSKPLSTEGARALGIVVTEVRTTGPDQGSNQFDFEARVLTGLSSYHEEPYPSILGFHAPGNCGVLRLVPALEHIEHKTGNASLLEESDWAIRGIQLAVWEDADLCPEAACSALPWDDTSIAAEFRLVLLRGYMRSGDDFSVGNS